MCCTIVGSQNSGSVSSTLSASLVQDLSAVPSELPVTTRSSTRSRERISNSAEQLGLLQRPLSQAWEEVDELPEMPEARDTECTPRKFQGEAARECSGSTDALPETCGRQRSFSSDDWGVDAETTPGPYLRNTLHELSTHIGSHTLLSAVLEPDCWLEDVLSASASHLRPVTPATPPRNETGRGKKRFCRPFPGPPSSPRAPMSTSLGSHSAPGFLWSDLDIRIEETSSVRPIPERTTVGVGAEDDLSPIPMESLPLLVSVTGGSLPSHSANSAKVPNPMLGESPKSSDSFPRTGRGTTFSDALTALTAATIAPMRFCCADGPRVSSNDHCGVRLRPCVRDDQPRQREQCWGSEITIMSVPQHWNKSDCHLNNLAEQLLAQSAAPEIDMHVEGHRISGL